MILEPIFHGLCLIGLRKCFEEFSGSILESKRGFGVRMVKWEMFLPFK